MAMVVEYHFNEITFKTISVGFSADKMKAEN